MSFQLNTATALPAEVQLGKEKPQGAFALRSRYALSANSASSWNAGTTLTLPLQTGTPGTFTDVKQGIIQATVQIVNTNPYVDFLNFGPSGAMIFFDEMRVYSSGTPVEENLRYSETADLLMIQGGHQCRPFKMYRRNKWLAANGLAGDKHINFIKPSMVDALGCPMFGRTPFMDNNSAVYCPPSISIGTTTVVGPYNSQGLATAAGANTSSGSLIGTLPFYDGNVSGASASIADPTLGYLYGIGGGSQTSALHRTQADSGLADISLENHKQVRVAQYGRTRNTGNFANAQAASYVPSQWPDYQPFTIAGQLDDEEIDSILGKTKISEYMKYLCNVRGLPIGVSGVISEGSSYCASSAQLTAVNPGASNDVNIRYVQYRVSMPFLSGIYGIFADKMFPDMLIGANNMRIEFKLAQNVKALWTTMDPCRRVPGTLRDFVPFTGTASGVDRSQPYATVQSGAIANAAWGCSSSLVASTTAAAALDTSIVANSQMYNTLAALGQDLITTFSYTTNIAALATSAISVENGVGSHCYNSSNLPKPQYVPVSRPWEKTGPKTYVSENAVCFGTYLPAAQAQSRRCWPNTKLNATTDSFANAGQTYFTIRDIQYIGEQVQLDDVVTSAIIQSAATSEVVVWTRGYRSFEASCDQNAQQNIILPIQIGQAEALYLIFRPSVLLTSPDYYSNSFCCPFVGLSFNNADATTLANNDNVVPDVGGSYTLNSSLDTAGSGIFSYQLFSGTKQYPLQPIQTVSELITEREKSTHSLHNWAYCSTENMALTSWNARFGNSALSTGLDLDPFLDFGYFTTFVPILALDDQTITQNPYLQVVELTEDYDAALGAGAQVRSSASRIRGRRAVATPAVSVNNGAGTSYSGVLNRFIAPVGSFYLGWDFESWTNHQDVMRTGKFLGQEQVSVRMTGTYLCNASSVLVPGQIAQMQTVQCTAIVPHVVKLSFVPGGHMLSYY
jgi:hypothetical protein